MPSRHNDENVSPRDENHVDADVHERSTLWSVWENNKGALLVLLAELVGSSSDAVARYLQQGGAGLHTLQVSIERALGMMTQRL